jgi:tetratricopeptide (TPR) repeat protein
MRHLSWGQVSVLLLLAARAAGAQVPNANQNTQPPSSPLGDKTRPAEAGQSQTTPTDRDLQEVKITAQRAEPPLPPLRPDEFNSCIGSSVAATTGTVGIGSIDWAQAAICEQQLNGEKRAVVEACINRDGKTALPRVVQACTESLEHKIFEGRARFFLFANRAAAYFALGDKQHALDDYNEAVKLAPQNAELYYNRGVFYAAQPDNDAALRDFDAAIGIDPKQVRALHQRARIYYAKNNLSGALADYSEAIRLEPKTAALWKERGIVSLQQHDYQGAVRDEGQAIQLDPKLAQAYYLRGIAFANLQDSGNASSDVKSAVDLDPSLAHYVTIKGKTVSLAVPPL